MARPPTVPAELTSGPFTLVEAQRLGLTRRQLMGATWRRVDRGVYVWARLADSPALVLSTVKRRLPPEAAFSGRTAAWLHGLDLSPCEPVEVTVPEERGISARAGMVVRRAKLANHEIVQVRGVRATSALRTVVDLGSRLPLVEAVVATDMALHGRLVDLAELSGYVAANPRRKGIARLRDVIDLAEPATESAMETRLRLLLVLAGLPRPEVQVPLHDERGRHLGRPDLYYPVHRLGLEYDGGTHRDSLVQDDRRQNRLVNAGYRLLRFTGADVQRTPDSVVLAVRSALALRAWSSVHPPADVPMPEAR
jgi:hypothetical protein